MHGSRLGSNGGVKPQNRACGDAAPNDDIAPLLPLTECMAQINPRQPPVSWGHALVDLPIVCGFFLISTELKF
jgi:hypothetical protein